MAIYAGQAGMLPGVAIGGTSPEGDLSETAARADAVRETSLASASTAAFVPDAFAGMQGAFLPPRSFFSTAPDVAPVPPAPVPLAAAPDAAPRPAAFAPAARPFVPGPQRTEPVRAEPLRAEPLRDGNDKQALSPLGLPCGLDLTAEAAPSAMIALGIAAPCHPGTELVIRHAGLTIAARTDVMGLVTLDLPAFETPATVSVRLADGLEDTVGVAVPDLDDHDRLALAWTGDLGLELHAIEDGAAWLSEGHLRPEAPGDPLAQDARRGFLTLLGDASRGTPSFAQVFTRPRLGDGPQVSLSIDAPITERNCTMPVEARILRSDAGRLEVTPLRFTYPGCDAVGDVLVLQNLEQGLRLAAN
jgi:hypothetical protein